MNELPLLLYRAIKSYFTDINRIWRVDEKKLRKYRDKALKKMVRYAYEVPLYKKKYGKKGIHLDDIKGMNDLEKLPLISKEDIRKNFPDGIVAKDDKKILLTTSGSTGKPVSIYCDQFSAIKSLEGYVRELKFYGGSWMKSKIALLIDLSPESSENAFFAGSAMPILKKFISLKNIKLFHIGEEPKLLMAKMNKFEPEFIGSHPGMLRNLAFLKKNGQGKNVEPEFILSSGEVLDTYTRNYIEDAFGTRIFDTYGTTEAGPIAFQCREGNYHVHSDFVHLEFLDDDGEPVVGKPGRVVVTKLYGRGTPIIRYTGIEDMAVPLEGKCSCGLETQLIKKIEGRRADSIILPDGETIPPLSITGIPGEVMSEFGDYRIKQFQIVQKSPDEMELLVVIDEKMREIGPSPEKIRDEMKEKYQKKLGIEVKVREVSKIKKGASLVESRVKDYEKMKK